MSPLAIRTRRRATLVIDALLAARNNGTCVLVATHDPDIIAAADEVLPLRAS